MEEKAAQVEGEGRALGQKARTGEEAGRPAKMRRVVLVGFGRRAETASGRRAVVKMAEGPAGYAYAATLVMPQERSARRTQSWKRKQSTRWSMAMPAACMKE